MPFAGKVVWLRDWNPSERAHRRARAFLERSVYWKYQQINDFASNSEQGEFAS